MQEIYVHGLGQTAKCWEKMLAHLKRGEEALCPDLAALVSDREISYKSLYSAFCDYCDEVEGEIALCGLSLGAVLALNYAIDHPEKVKSLALIAAQYRMPKVLLRIQNIIFGFMPGRMFQETGFSKKDFIRLCGDMAELDFSDGLYRINCPVLAVCGERDGANLKASREIVKHLKDARLQIIENGGHEVNTEATEVLARVLGDFYSRAE